MVLALGDGFENEPGRPLRRGWVLPRDQRPITNGERCENSRVLEPPAEFAKPRLEQKRHHVCHAGGALLRVREAVDAAPCDERLGATHLLCKTLPNVATEMALCVLTYNLTRVLNIVGVEKLMEAIRA